MICIIRQLFKGVQIILDPIRPACLGGRVFSIQGLHLKLYKITLFKYYIGQKLFLT